MPVPAVVQRQGDFNPGDLEGHVAVDHRNLLAASARQRIALLDCTFNLFWRLHNCFLVNGLRIPIAPGLHLFALLPPLGAIEGAHHRYSVDGRRCGIQFTLAPWSLISLSGRATTAGFFITRFIPHPRIASKIAFLLAFLAYATLYELMSYGH